MFNIKTLLGQIKTAAQTLKEQVTELDTRLADAQKRRDIITRESVSIEDYMRYVRADIKEKGDYFWRNYLKHDIQKTARQYTALETSIGLDYLNPGINRPVVISEEGLFFYFGDLIAARIEQAIRADMDWATGVMPVAERKKIVSSLDAEILEIRQQRKALTDELIDAGLAG